MRPILLATLLSALMSSYALAAEAHKSSAASILDRYLQLPCPPADPMNEARTARLKVLRELRQHPDETVLAIAAVLPAVADTNRRSELAEALGFVPTRAAADQLIKLLGDADDRVRWQAIHNLRKLAGCVDRVSPARQQRAPEHLPPVDGLVPHLIAAASDNAAANRVCAAYALADTLDPAAVAQLRKMLKDDEQDVRFHAACFLTEFADAAGLPELRKSLDRFGRPNPDKFENDFQDFQVQRLLASMERITGKSFGPIPMPPSLMSDTRQAAAARKQYQFLLDAWAQWWAWEPKPADR